jgi:hypothetical protein
MVPCSPLGEVAAANIAKAENVGEAEIVMEVVPPDGGDEIHVMSGNEGHVSSIRGTDDSTNEKAFDDESMQTYNFGDSTDEMVEKGYFVDGKARAPRLH